MLNEWVKVAIGKYSSKIGSGATPRGGSSVYLSSGEISLIRSQNIYNEGFKSNGLVYIDQQAADKLSNVEVLDKDVLINITGDSVARCCLAPPNHLPARVNQHVAIIRPNPEEFDAKFVRYCLIAPNMQHFLLSIAGSGGTRNALTKVMLEKLEIPKPLLPEQKAIAHILGSLDDKIELNRKMNETLEAMAQALFKSWFVDFDPVIDNALAVGNEIPDELTERAEQRKALGDKRKHLPEEIRQLFPSEFELTDEMGWIPKGWKVGLMSEVVEVKYGKDHKKLQNGEIPVYGSGGIMRYADVALCETESVLIPRKGTLNNIMYVDHPFWSVDTMFFTKFKEDNHAKYIYYFLKQFNFDDMNVGSAVPSMTTKVLNNMNVLFPENEVVKKFDIELKTIYDKKNANNGNIKTLSKLRDTLLPKLLSGELHIKATEKLVEEVV
jgi:type I restriction enzyme S subunit